MGRDDNNPYRWVTEIMQAFQAEKVGAEAVATAFLTFSAENAKNRAAFMSLMNEIGPMAVKFDEMIKAKAKAEPEPQPEMVTETEPETMPAELVAALKLMGIDPGSVQAAFVPRPVAQVQAKDGKVKSGKYAGLDCECPSCLQLYGALFSNGTDGEA